MASVTVKVDISEQSLKDAVNNAPGTKRALNSLSAKIASRANAMAVETTGIWHETGKAHNPDKKGGKWHDHGETYSTVGDKKAAYDSKPAKMYDGCPVGIVVPTNYAAQKDNYEHNTLLKAKG